MAEQEKKTSVEWLWEAPKDALSDMMQKLKISPEIQQKIQQLQWEKKERCQLSLEDILVEVEEQKLWPTDRNKKIQDTLEKEYAINFPDQKKKLIESIDNTVWDFEKLQKNLESVKNLNQTIVSEELAEAKKEPLPEQTKIAIAKATNIDQTQVDEAIKKGDNPQINNLVDTYYLTSAKVQSAIESRLPESKRGESNIAFQELRASAGGFEILHPFTPSDLPSRLSDKSDKTQQEVISTFNSINKDNPNTLITRTGDKLTWEWGKEWEKYEIDMSVHPPVLSKSRDGLSISRTEQAENPELKGARESLNKSKDAYQEASKDIHSDLKNAWYYQNLDNFSIEEVEKAFSGGDFDTYQERMKTAKTPEEQKQLQTEIREHATQAEGVLAKIGFSYMDKILEDRIDMGDIGIENAGWETATEKDLNEKLNALGNLKSSDKLTKYTEARRKYEKEQEAIKKIETPGVDTFDEKASETLGLLASLGYDELGQKWLNDLLEAVNFHNKWTVEPINLNQNPQLDQAQEKALRNLSEDILQRFQKQAEKSGKTPPTTFRELWQGITKGIQNADFREQKWNTREKREQFLFGKPNTQESIWTQGEAQK